MQASLDDPVVLQLSHAPNPVRVYFSAFFGLLQMLAKTPEAILDKVYRFLCFLKKLGFGKYLAVFWLL